jgi:hypothetical protein
MVKLTEVAAYALQGMLSSQYVGEFIVEGNSHSNKILDKHDALSTEAMLYAKVLIGITENG